MFLNGLDDDVRTKEIVLTTGIEKREELRETLRSRIALMLGIRCREEEQNNLTNNNRVSSISSYQGLK